MSSPCLRRAPLARLCADSRGALVGLAISQQKRQAQVAPQAMTSPPSASPDICHDADPRFLAKQTFVQAKRLQGLRSQFVQAVARTEMEANVDSFRMDTAFKFHSLATLDNAEKGREKKVLQYAPAPQPKWIVQIPDL